MRKYVVLTAEKSGFPLMTAMVLEDEFEGSFPEDFFPPDYSCEKHGTVTVEGEAENYMPSVFVGE